MAGNLQLVWRLAKERYAARPLDGDGARLYGSRWTSPGRPVVYLSTELACAALEVLVHIGRIALAPRDYSVIGVAVPLDLWSAADVVTDAELGRGWQAAGSTACRNTGDEWITRHDHAAMLRVPSAVVSGVTNVLLDPMHPHASRIRIESVAPFTFDARLFGSA